MHEHKCYQLKGRCTIWAGHSSYIFVSKSIVVHSVKKKNMKDKQKKGFGWGKKQTKKHGH